ncbi:unnamed protein product [Polarella glacialis]|uniref:Uncharacterized protein n=2 Tax=Polarella glacialis TaxID=89957 RepID=A0A813HR01_POLGL|nr:unnamed protein product [Polarella glacialis]
MSEQAFRRAVFEFLLPPGYFESHMRSAAAAEPAQLTAASAAEPVPPPAQDEEPEKPVSSEQSEEVELSLALELSQQEANAEENSHVAEALLRSRSEARLSGDGVVLLRLDSHARSPQVAEALLYSPELAPCRAMVAEAGCELQPAWAGGAWLFVPLKESQFQEAGPDLHANVKHIHILALSEHEPLVHQALKCVPRKCRPKCYHESLGAPAALSVPGASSCGAFEETVSRGDTPPGSSEVGSPASPTLNQDRSSAGRLNGDFAYDIVVQRTFIHFPSPSSDASTERHSAP